MYSKVAIIILNWNGKEDTIECLESLKHITYPNYEILLVDNGSTDGSVECFRERYPGMEIIENGENLGFAEGNNVGIRRAMDEGVDYVLLLNNDTVVDPKFLGELVKVAKGDERIGIVGAKILNYYDRTIDFCGGNINWWIGQPYHIKEEYCGKTDFITGCAMLIKKEIFEKGLFFDKVYFLYFEDADLCEKVKRIGYFLEVTNKSIVYHKISRSSKKNGTKSDFFVYYFARNRIIFNKRYNINMLKYLTFLFYQYIIKTIGAYFSMDKNLFRSWLMGLGLIAGNKKLPFPQDVTQKKREMQ